jgi:hypothetical protein
VQDVALHELRLERMHVRLEELQTSLELLVVHHLLSTVVGIIKSKLLFQHLTLVALFLRLILVMDLIAEQFLDDVFHRDNADDLPDRIKALLLDRLADDTEVSQTLLKVVEKRLDFVSVVDCDDVSHNDR